MVNARACSPCAAPTKMLVDAYNLVGGKLEKVWSWNGDDRTPKVRRQGMHGMHAADVDGDGRGKSSSVRQ